MTLKQGNLFIESNTNNKPKCSFNNVIETLDNMNKIKITVNYSEQKPNLREKENKYNKALSKYSNNNLQSNEEMLKQYPRTKVFDKYIINQETRDIVFSTFSNCMILCFSVTEIAELYYLLQSALIEAKIYV